MIDSHSVLPIEGIQAILFDFDGLIVDTESPGYSSWNEIYGELGVELAPEVWAQAVGTLDGFDPVAHLGALTGVPVDRARLLARREERKGQLASLEAARPGVAEWISEADRLALERGIVSSGGRDWIERHLRRLGLADGWACIACADGDPARAKPNPYLYEAALEDLSVIPSQAVAFEDSPNGIAAAKQAGLWCICVPNPITEGMDLSEADMVVTSLYDFRAAEHLGRWSRRPPGGLEPRQ